MTLPSCAELLAAVRVELRDRIAPNIDDDGLRSSLTLIDEILRIVAIRADNEVAWMLQEIADIENLAARVLDAGPNVDVARAMTRLRAERSSSSVLADVQRDYDIASRVLSACVEATIAGGGSQWAAVKQVLERRLATEEVIRGADFALAARR